MSLFYYCAVVFLLLFCDFQSIFRVNLSEILLKLCGEVQMEDETRCDDPQFMNMLETCLRVEIETAKGTLSGLESEIKECKARVQMQLKSRAELREKTKNAQENILALTMTLNKQNKCINEISDKIELMKLNLDGDYKIMKLECEKYKDIYKEYGTTWKSYYARYEEFPLAKVRRDAEARLLKLEVDKMVLRFKIGELEKISRQQQRITWLRMREKIVGLARVISNKFKLEEKLQSYDKTIQERRKELNTINMELAVQLKRKEEEKRDRALKLLEMPPPKIHFSHMRTIYERRSRTVGLPDYWGRNCENSIDSLSVDTLMLEELCEAEESLVQVPPEPSPLAAEEVNLDYDQRIDARSPSSDLEEQEVEHEDAVSEVDGNAASRPIDAVEEEVEHPMKLQLEHLEQPSAAGKDKQTSQRGEDLAEDVDDPVARRMRWISDEQTKAVLPSPIRSIRLEKKKSQSVDPSPRAKIARIEAVRYNVTPLRKLEKSSANRVAAQGPPTAESPLLKLTKTSSMRTPAQGNPNPSSMFTPHRYDFSDNSGMSFCVDNNMEDLKVDQISLYGGSVRDLCEYSNISSPNEDAEMEVLPEVGAPSTSKAPNFPQFDFSNILKRTSSRNKLF